MIRTHKPTRYHRAAAATELALVLPLLLLLTFAGVDFGRGMHCDIALSNAARAGAEYGSLHRPAAADPDAWEEAVHEAVINEITGTPWVDANELEISIDTTTDLDGLYYVQVSATFPFATIVNWPGIPHEVTLHQSVQMRQLR